MLTVPSDFELMFPIKFVDRNSNKIHICNWIPVNNFFGHQIKSIAVLRKDDQEKMLSNLPSGSVARYSQLTRSN